MENDEKMVIKANELTQKIKTIEADKLKTAEDSIDQRLMSGFDGRQITISANIMKGISEVGKEALIDKYKQAGWDVKYHFDQRDGDFYELRPMENATARQYKEQSSQAQDFVKLKYVNNWGSLYYTHNNKQVEFNQGDVMTIRWPDKTQSQEKITLERVVEHVSDMGHQYDVSSDIPVIRKTINKQPVKIDNLENLRFARNELQYLQE